jgi:N6-L-threonylcarbamoyladenine synthase
MAYALGIPLFGIHHHEAHLYSPWIDGKSRAADWAEFRPHVALIVSGGHTLLVAVNGLLNHQVLGGTLDDAAGECFDKTAKLLGLPYPGGPVLDRLAAEGDPTTHAFPRPRITDPDDDFSFSGLKTSVRYWLERHPAIADDPRSLRNLCASIQAAIVEVLAVKAVRAAKRLGVGGVTASGGVTCNSGLRRELATRCERHRLWLRIADPSLCTDNAAMVAVLGERLLLSGAAPDTFEAETRPSWPLDDLIRP